MWDNRVDKRNPKSPDFKCKNKNCNEAIWEKRDAVAPSNGNGAVHSAQSTQRALGPLYNECLDFARKACAHHFGEVEPGDVISAAATLFTQAVRDGLPIRAAKPAPAPPPPPPPVPAYDPYADERDLPF